MDETKRILISVITVTWNCRTVIEHTLRSIVKNREEDMETVLIDGGSTDGTLDIIETYKDHLDYFISEEDRGIYHAMNKGIIAAKGEYLIFINAGDILLDGFHDRFMSVSSSSEDIFFFNFKHYLPTKYGTVYLHSRFHSIHSGMPTCHNSIFFKRDLFEKFGLYNEKYKICSDYEFLCRVYGKATTRFVRQELILYLREGASQINHSTSLLEKAEVAGKYFGYRVSISHYWNFLKVLPVHCLKLILKKAGLFEWLYHRIHSGKSQ